MTLVFNISTNWEIAESKVLFALDQVGFRALKSFDLKLMDINLGRECFYHSSGVCDCEIIVLLLYSDRYSGVTLNGFCRDGKVEFNLNECEDYTKISEKVAKAFLIAHRILKKEGFRA